MFLIDKLSKKFEDLEFLRRLAGYIIFTIQPTALS